MTKAQSHLPAYPDRIARQGTRLGKNPIPRQPGIRALQEKPLRTSYLARYERGLAEQLLGLVPSWVGSRHLTLLTVLWSTGAIAVGAVARSDSQWLLLLSALILLQYVTDAVDGKVGRSRNEGLVRWGFYMDHLLDYVFLCSLLICYSLVLPAEYGWVMVASLAVAGCFMVSSFLNCAAEGRLEIAFLRIGPFEVRLLLAATNVWLAAGGRLPLTLVLPLVLGMSVAALLGLVYVTQRRLLAADLALEEAVAPAPD